MSEDIVDDTWDGTRRVDIDADGKIFPGMMVAEHQLPLAQIRVALQMSQSLLQNGLFQRGKVTGIKYKAGLGVAYGASLRVSEVAHLKVDDFDSTRMLIRVDQGKGWTFVSSVHSPEFKLNGSSN